MSEYLVLFGVVAFLVFVVSGSGVCSRIFQRLAGGGVSVLLLWCERGSVLARTRRSCRAICGGVIACEHGIAAQQTDLNNPALVDGSSVLSRFHVVVTSTALLFLSFPNRSFHLLLMLLDAHTLCD